MSNGTRAHKSKVPFYQGQHPIVLGKMDLIDPTSLDDYLAVGGYQALRKALYGDDPGGGYRRGG